MDSAQVSKLGFYSLGIVAAHKPLKTPYIEVLPIEDSPMLDGELTDNVEQYKSKTQNADGAKKSVEIQTTASIRAEWLPINNSNRVTPPDVRRGEQVVLYRFGDTDKYWWNTLKNDSKLRRLETVIYAWSNNRAEDAVDDASSTYFLEVSTHNKVVHFHTSKNDGEPVAWDVQINAKDGIFTVTDDTGNTFQIDAKAKRLTMQNGDGSTVDIDKTNILFKCTDTITLDSKDVKVKAANETSITSSKNTVKGDLTASDKVKVEGRMTMNSGMDSTNGSGGESVFNGSLRTTGNLHADGNIDATGSITAPNLAYV